MSRLITVLNGFRSGLLRRRGILPLLSLALLLTPLHSTASNRIDNDELGAWTMYFWNTKPNEKRWLMQGDVQYRTWDVGNDLEQLLLRSSVGYSFPESRGVLAGGYAFIRSEQFGPGSQAVDEHRVYQEFTLPQTVMSRVHLTHRFRFEQRFVDGQDMRTRGRYALFANIPLNQQTLAPGAVYLALYNEVFINGERDIGDGARVDYFDRNRAYIGIGKTVLPGLRLQLGFMRQNAPNFDKNQLQFGFHHTF
jgi:hypothetical protein